MVSTAPVSAIQLKPPYSSAMQRTVVVPSLAVAVLPMSLGVAWSDDRLIAVHEDGTAVRHEWYSDAFQRLRERAGLRRIHLKGLRNTSVSLMLDQRHPVHIVAAWHGHDSAVSQSIYSDAKADELRAAGASLFG